MNTIYKATSYTDGLLEELAILNGRRITRTLSPRDRDRIVEIKAELRRIFPERGY